MVHVLAVLLRAYFLAKDIVLRHHAFLLLRKWPHLIIIVHIHVCYVVQSKDKEVYKSLLCPKIRIFDVVFNACVRAAAAPHSCRK